MIKRSVKINHYCCCLLLGCHHRTVFFVTKTLVAHIHTTSRERERERECLDTSDRSTFRTSTCGWRIPRPKLCHLPAASNWAIVQSLAPRITNCCRSFFSRKGVSKKDQGLGFENVSTIEESIHTHTYIYIYTYTVHIHISIIEHRLIFLSSSSCPKKDSHSQRTTGTWRHTVDTLADPLFSQTIVARRMSVYWDLDQAHRHFASSHITGEEVFAHFKRLNLRETFSACVVEKLMELYPPSHPRRRYMEGPTFRERLDYHQYIVFPAGLNAHITANKNNEATKVQKAPLRDADVVVYSLDVAIDSEQLRSVNALLSYVKNFALKDTLMLSRPAEAIRDAKDSSSRRSLIRAWWQHASKAIQIICKIPKRELCAEDLQHRAALRERYILAVNRAKDLQNSPPEGNRPNNPEEYALAMEEVMNMQMMLKLKDILDWRMQARDRRAVEGSGAAEGNEVAESKGSKESRSKERPRPQTLQVKVTFQGFQVFFLVAQDEK